MWGQGNQMQLSDINGSSYSSWVSLHKNLTQTFSISSTSTGNFKKEN